MMTNDCPKTNLIPFQPFLGGHWLTIFSLWKEEIGCVLDIFIGFTYDLELLLKTH